MRSGLSLRALNLALCLALVAGRAPLFGSPPSYVDPFTHETAGSMIESGGVAIDLAANHTGLFAAHPLQTLSASDLWVDAGSGSDGNDGLTRATAFRSIQKAADFAASGTTVHILPGIYREAVRPVFSGSPAKPVIYRAEAGRGTAIIRGSEPTATLVWNQLTDNSIGLRPGIDPGSLYYADLSGWGLDAAPRFVVQVDGRRVTRLPVAREPDWQVTTAWKYAEFWWAADGGSSPADCDPASNADHDCDEASRSTIQLTDRNSDTEPAGIELGNLTTLGDLTGATVVALDTDEGHYVYHRRIVGHDVLAGTITVDQPCEFDSGSSKPGLGWGSKYYLEDHPALLDAPGEWWYDTSKSRLYLWPVQPASPATQNIEISRRGIGFDLTDRSYITIDGLTIEFLNDSAVSQLNNDNSKSYQNTVHNSALRYANVGVELGQSADGPAGNITDGFTLEDSEVGWMDSRAIRLNYWWAGGIADSFTHAGIVNTVLRSNELHDLGFRSDGDNSMGVLFNHPDRLRFEGNYVHHVAQNGVAFSRSVIQSPKDRGFSPGEIKTGEIIIANNVFERSCLLNADCGELKIQGSAPDNHVFRDLLITGNVFRDTFGWTYISEKRGRWSGGPQSEIRGMGGFGLYVDNASGVHAYRNIAYNNASTGFHLYSDWWDGEIVLYNNVISNSLNGIRLDGNSQPSTDTQIGNNIIANNEGYGILIYQPQGDYGYFFLDHNLYYKNGWRAIEAGGARQPGDMALYHPSEYYERLDDIRTSTPWEHHGMEGDPIFQHFSFADHDIFDDSRPDFHPTSDSVNSLNTGTTTLPESLTRLLDAFGVNDFRRGPAYDMGRYEKSFEIIASPGINSVCPGNAAQYAIRLDTSDLPHELALAVVSPSPVLDVSLSSSRLTPEEPVTLTVSENPGGLWSLSDPEYEIPITAAGAGITESISVRVLAGGIRTCLPLILGNWLRP